MIRCAGCARDMDATASICVDCRRTLEVALTNVAAYWRDLDTLRSGQVRYGSAAGQARSTGERRLGMDLRFAPTGKATTVEQATRTTVVSWTQYVLDRVRPDVGPVCVACCHPSCSGIRKTAHPSDTIASCCAYLVRFADWLRVSPVGGDVLAEIVAIERRLRNLIDRPAPEWYAGQCGSTTTVDGVDVICTRELRARDTRIVRCPDCGCTYDVQARRSALLLEAEDRQATVETIASFVTTVGDPSASQTTIASRVQRWARSGEIASHGQRVVMGRPRPLYRIGDVLDLIARNARRAERKAAS